MERIGIEPMTSSLQKSKSGFFDLQWVSRTSWLSQFVSRDFGGFQGAVSIAFPTTLFVCERRAGGKRHRRLLALRTIEQPSRPATNQGTSRGQPPCRQISGLEVIS
jgi:hypothetical protein